MIELGAGTGLVGMVASALGKKLVTQPLCIITVRDTLE